MKKAVILDRAKRKTANGLPLTEEERRALESQKERRDYMREYMRNYRATHPEYRKRSTQQGVERKKLDPDKWRPYMREYLRKYRERLKLKQLTEQ